MARFSVVRVCLLAAFAATPFCLFADSLDELPALKEFRAARQSSYDRSGGNLDMRSVAPGETLEIANVQGPGCINHIWFTHMYSSRMSLRKLVLRAYFDGAETPCIEAPLGDFFGLGHTQTYSYASATLAIGTSGGLNSYWRMPFNKGARLTVTNDGKQRCGALYFQVDYQKYDKPSADATCFHAQYRQTMPCVKGQPYVLLEATGRGHYVGCNLSIEQLEDSWWGEGDDKFFVDAETTPSIWGTGSEDYFLGAWCFSHEYAYPFFGMPFRARLNNDGNLDHYWPDLRGDAEQPWRWPHAWLKGDLWNVYRYHIQDPVPFTKSIRVEIEHGATDNERQDAYSSVAYWYQTEPHAKQPGMPTVGERTPYFLRPQEREPGLFEAEDLVDESTATRGELVESDQSFWGKAFSRHAMLEWNAKGNGDELAIPVSVGPGRRRVTVETVSTRRSGEFQMSVDDNTTGPVDLYLEAMVPIKVARELGTIDLPSTQTVTLRFRSTGKNAKSEARQLAIDTIRFKPI